MLRVRCLLNPHLRDIVWVVELLRAIVALLTAFIAPRCCLQQARVSLGILRMPVAQVRFA